jgi:hypothetical protein
MSRIAEASARAGRAVPDNSRVDWTKQREAAERLLSGAAAEQAAPPPPAVASPLALDSIEQTFSWPPEFDLDEVDLSRDPHARNFRRPRPTSRQRVEVDDQTPPRHQQRGHESVASSVPPRMSAIVVPPRETAASSKRGTHREPVRAEARRVTPRWVVVAVALLVLLASAALLTYLLRNRQVTARQQNVQLLANSAPLAPISIDMPVSATETGAVQKEPLPPLRTIATPSA